MIDPVFLAGARERSIAFKASLGRSATDLAISEAIDRLDDCLASLMALLKAGDSLEASGQAYQPRKDARDSQAHG